MMKSLLWWCIWLLLSSSAVSAQTQPPKAEDQRITDHRPLTTAHQLPCLSSDPACVTTLSYLAVQNSREIAVLEKAIQLQKKKLWTNWLNADGLNPMAIGLRIARNVAGGGDRAAAKLEIARLELRRAELETNLHQTITHHILEYETAQQQWRLAEAHLTTHQTRLALLTIAYQQGEGGTEAMLQLWQTESDLQHEVATAQTLLRQRQTQLHSLVFPPTS